MLKHLVFMKFHPDASPERIGDMEKGLGALPQLIPEIKYYDFGRDVMRSDRSFDFGLISHFDDRQSLRRYAEHPEHQKVLAVIKEICVDIAAVDFISDSDR
jgi:hypothetical protein